MLLMPNETKGCESISPTWFRVDCRWATGRFFASYIDIGLRARKSPVPPRQTSKSGSQAGNLEISRGRARRWPPKPSLELGRSSESWLDKAASAILVL